MRGVGRWESRNQKKKEVVYWTSEEETKQSKKKKYETEYGTNGRSRAHDDDRVTRFSNPLPNPTLQSAGDKNLLNRSTDRLKLKDDRLGGTRIVE